METKMDYQLFANDDITITIYREFYLENSKNMFIRIETSKKIKIYTDKKIIDLTNITFNEDNVRHKYFLISKNSNLTIEYNDNKFMIEYEKKYIDIKLYCSEIYDIINGLLSIFDCDLTSEINNINDAKIIFKKLVSFRKLIGRFRRFYHKEGYALNDEINIKFCKILANTKELLNLFTNDCYYYNEFKTIINNSKLPDNKYSISIIQKNMDLLDKIFKNYNNKIKSLEDPVKLLAKNFKNEESYEQYFSPIAQTNWLDSLQENQFCGLIVRSKPDKNFIFSKNISDVDIINITRATIDLDMFFSFMNQYYNKNNNYDNGTEMPLIKGNGLGEGNCLIPIYINPLHWKLANKFVPLFTALATTLNPGLYIKHSLYIYHNILITMLRDTFKNKNLDDKWLNMLITIYVTTYEVNKMCDKINWDDFINDPNKRLYQNITSSIQILGQFLLDGVEIYRNNKDKFFRLCQLIFEEHLRRLGHLEWTNKCINFTNVMNNNYEFLKLKMNDINKHDEYFLMNGTLLGIFLFDKLMGSKMMKEFINDFIINDSLLKVEQINEIKNFVKDNSETFELTIKKINYLTNPNYPEHHIVSNIKSYPIDTINKITQKYLMKILINEQQLNYMLVQNVVQKNEKSRRLAIEKGKYFDPFLQTEKVISSCQDYFKKRIIYETIENIKTKEQLLSSDFYKFYQDNKYKNELEQYIKNNKIIKELFSI
jgi:hypothetical protein